MGGLGRLEITSFRNIERCALAPHPELNVIVGPNASGKTSFLEAIHYLALGRSFRTSSVKPLIRIGDDQTVLFAELSGGTKIGLHRTRKGDQQLKCNGLAQRSWEGVAREIPIQLLDATSFSLLNEGPRLRRRFLDWGVFHVEQQFLPAWRRTRKSIMHRNALLKQAGRLDEEQLAIWEEELVSGAIEITASRERYFHRLQEAFGRALSTLSEELGGSISLHFNAGWNREHELGRLLYENRGTDRNHGVTRYGPHRADILVKAGNDRAIDVSSRGQQKLIVSALKIAQGELFFETREQRPIYLVDDLAAELDEKNRERVFHLLCSLGAQLFITCVAVDALESSLPDASSKSLFHVEHGTITA